MADLFAGREERRRRQWAAAEARDLGWGGVTAVAEATGLSRTTIGIGMKELALPAKRRAAEAMRVRRPGGGRRPLSETDPELLAALEGRKGAELWAVSAADGTKLAQVNLASEPVFDGMAVAEGRLYVAAIDGKIISLGTAR